MIRKISPLLKNSISGFIADSALSHAAAIAYFTIFAIGPLLIIIIAVAGLVFGADAVRHAIVDQFSGLMGSKSGEAIQTAIQGVDAGRNAKGVWATLLGIGALLVTERGAFSEIQSTLNLIWKANLNRVCRAWSAPELPASVWS